jgi:branched-chain amino acid transport system permease protein
MSAFPRDHVARRARRSMAGTTPERVVVFVGVGLFIVLLPEFSSSRHLFLASIAGTTAVVAYGLGVIFGQAGILSIAHAGLWAIGAYTGAIFHREFGWSYWAVLPLAMVFASFAAALLAYPALRIRGHFFLIATFAFGELVRIILENGGGFESGRRLGLIVSGGMPDFFGIGLQSANSIYYVTVAYVAIAIFAVWFIRRSAFGFTLRAIRENEDLAESVGIHLSRNKILAFTVSGAFAGAAGVHYAFLLQHISPSLFGAPDGIQLALIVLLGGAVPLLGPLVGAGTVTFLPELPFITNPNFVQIFYGLMLIVIILLLPSGIVSGISRGYGWVKRVIIGARNNARAPSGGRDDGA